MLLCATFFAARNFQAALVRADRRSLPFDQLGRLPRSRAESLRRLAYFVSGLDEAQKQ
jgi:hypothetical protein